MPVSLGTGLPDLMSISPEGGTNSLAPENCVALRANSWKVVEFRCLTTPAIPMPPSGLPSAQLQKARDRVPVEPNPWLAPRAGDAAGKFSLADRLTRLPLGDRPLKTGQSEKDSRTFVRPNRRR